MTRPGSPARGRGVKGRPGFALVEVVVALVLLAVGTLALLGLLHQAAANARSADLRERILWRATEVADSLRTWEGGFSGADSIPGGGMVRWSVAGGSGWVAGWLPDSDTAWIRLPLSIPASGSVLEVAP